MNFFPSFHFLTEFFSDNPFMFLFILSILLYVIMRGVWFILRMFSHSSVETQMNTILRSQAEMQGRLETITKIFDTRQQTMNESINQKFDTMTGRIGETMSQHARSTWENLSKLQERMVAIDSAQTNIKSLAEQIVQLQSVLSNKQTRGIFGQSRMEAIVEDALPGDFYEFQATLSNGNRPDCLVRMPNNAPSLVIDAKFPLESWNSMRSAQEEYDKKSARQAFRRDMETHIRNVSDKYFIVGETQDIAFMFVPSESIFSEIHENFEEITQRAHRSRVVIVSPSLLMLSIQVIQAILKDARMRKETHFICNEVMRLMEDVERLDERIRKLGTHFKQTADDIDDVMISSGKIKKRGKKIQSLEFQNIELDDDSKNKKTL